MGHFFMGKDQTGGRSMEIWPKHFTYFFVPFPYFCQFIFRCLFKKYDKYEEYDGFDEQGAPIIRKGKCVKKAEFCQYKRLELRNTRLSAQSALDEYEDWIRKTKRLKLAVMTFPDPELIEIYDQIFNPVATPTTTRTASTTTPITVKNILSKIIDRDAYAKWREAKKKTEQLKRKHRIIQNHEYSLQRTLLRSYCKLKN